MRTGRISSSRRGARRRRSSIAPTVAGTSTSVPSRSSSWAPGSTSAGTLPRGRWICGWRKVQYECRAACFHQPLEVRAGQRLRALADDARVEMSDDAAANAATANTDPVPQIVREPDAVPERAPPPRPPGRAAERPRGSSRRGPLWPRRASSARRSSKQKKAGFEAECQRASGAELLTLGDAARWNGSAVRAEQAYTAAHRKLPGGGRASYGLGLVAFDQRGDFRARLVISRPTCASNRTARCAPKRPAA